MAKLSRRHFLTGFGSSLLGFGLVKKVNASLNIASSNPAGSSALQVKKYNPLGNTGLKVSDVSCGAISFFDPNVLRYAYDLGVNYFDTAETYMRQQSETYIGQSLKDVRDKIIITTKHGYDARRPINKEAILGRVEASLKRMQTDHVDIALIHGVDDLSLLENEELLSAYAQLKKEGKIRFTGFSSHNAQLTLRQALSSDFAQVVLVIYNHDEGKVIEPLIEQVNKKGIGVVVMKIFAGGKHGNLKSFINETASYPQAAIRWVMNNPNVNTCIPTMSSYSHVEEYVGASGQDLDRSDLKIISKYQRETYHEYCRVSCSECLSACPHHVAVGDILRYAMYFEDYRIEKEAIRCYSDLENNRKPLNCTYCSGICESACPYGLSVKKKLLHAHEILTV